MWCFSSCPIREWKHSYPFALGLTSGPILHHFASFVHAAAPSCGGEDKHPPWHCCTHINLVFTLLIIPDNAGFYFRGDVHIWCSCLVRLHLRVPCSCYQRGQSWRKAMELPPPSSTPACSTTSKPWLTCSSSNQPSSPLVSVYTHKQCWHTVHPPSVCHAWGKLDSWILWNLIPDRLGGLWWGNVVG